jgi:hypothetical protein
MRTNGIDFSETFRSETNREHEEFYFGFYLGYIRGSTIRITSRGFDTYGELCARQWRSG